MGKGESGWEVEGKWMGSGGNWMGTGWEADGKWLEGSGWEVDGEWLGRGMGVAMLYFLQTRFTSSCNPTEI
jgi:hypothetical protein